MNSRRIAFVDSRVAELVPLLRAQYPDVLVTEIEAGDDGLDQMLEALRMSSGMSAVDMFGHGEGASLQLGDKPIDVDALAARSSDWHSFGALLDDGAEVMLYGCRLAATNEGQDFVEQLARLSGRPVAAATADIGAQDRGGVWDLDFRTSSLPPARDSLRLPEFRGVLAAITGTSDGDALTGTEGDDTLDGAAGADTMTGAAGDDVYVVDNLGDVVVELPGEGVDTVQTSVTWTLEEALERLTLTGAAAIDGTGNLAHNLIVGNAAANVLKGMEGNDTIRGGDGDDLIYGEEPVTGVGSGPLFRLSESSFGDGAGVVTFETLGLVNPSFSVAVAEIGTVQVSTGGWFIGQAAGVLAGTVDTMTLIDTTPTANAPLTIDEASSTVQVVTDDAAMGSPVLSGANHQGTIAVKFSASMAAVGLRGGAFDAVGSTTIVAFDAMGRTIGSVSNSATGAEFFGLGMSDGTRSIAGISIHMTGQDLNGFSIDDLTFGAASSIIGLSETSDQLEGGAGNDTIYGGIGHDTLNGGTGADSLLGGSGDDTYFVDSVQDVVVEAAGGGTDRIYTSVNLALAAGQAIEQVYLAGSASQVDGNEFANTLVGGGLADSLNGADGHDSLLGGVGADTLRGGNGNDTLDGGVGIDSMAGGAGDDVYRVGSGYDVVVEAADEGLDTIYAVTNYALGAGQHVELLSADGRAVSLTGNELANRLVGSSLGDLLGGLAGNDTLEGGEGDDSLYGGDGADSLMGGAGNDRLDGGIGADTMAGGAGDDVYYVNSAADVVAEAVGDGVDKLYTSANFTLAAGAEIEQLYLTGTATSLIGNELNNALYGGGLNDMLSGMAGHDSLSGGVGNDTLYGGAGHDTLDGGVGSDSMIGGVGDDVYLINSASDVVVETTGNGTDMIITTANFTLAAGVSVEVLALDGSATSLSGNELANVLVGGALGDVLGGQDGTDLLLGGAGNDSLYGGAAGDTLVGGEGNDLLSGGLWGDHFVFDSELGPTNVDTISDWTTGDRIVLDSDIFTALSAGGSLSTAQFYSGAGLTGSSSGAQDIGIYYDTTTGGLYYDADGFDGAAALQFAIVTPKPVLTAGAFIVSD